MMRTVNSSIARGAFDIVPDDISDMTVRAFGVYCGTAGTLHYLGDDGVEDTVTLGAGQIWPVIVRKVFEDSTATNLKGFRLLYDNDE